MKNLSSIMLKRQDLEGNRPCLPLGVALLMILGLFLAPVARAQSPTNDLARLEVELWPDYDQSAVLVLLTGSLADDAPVPATFVLPVPEEATINAVAHVDVESGQLQNIAEVDTSTPGQLTFTTPSPTFRIEYYMPYTAEGDQREFTFDWRSDVTIDQVLTTVQQPAEANDFEVTPPAGQPTTGPDGLLYYPLNAQALPAGQSYLVTISYNLASDLLTADVLATRQPPVQGPLPVVSDAAQEDASEFNWPLVIIVAGGLIIVAAVAWFLYTSSQGNRKRPPRPRPVRQTTKTSSRPQSSSSSPASDVQFCHNCGQPVDPEDRFCRECGTAVKGR